MTAQLDDAQRYSPQVYISRFRINSFRGLDGLLLPDCSNVNILTGPNGIGKTATLEALWLFNGRYNGALFFNPLVQRSISTDLNPLRLLSANELVSFSGDENNQTYDLEVEFIPYTQGETTEFPKPATINDENAHNVPISGKLQVLVNGVESKVLTIIQTPQGLVSTNTSSVERPNCYLEGVRGPLEYAADEMARYSEIVKQGLKDDLKEALELFHPNLADIELLSGDHGVYLSGLTRDGNRYPLQMFGGGAIRMFRIYLAIFSSKKGMVLIDEIENGVYYAFYPKLWEKIRIWSDEWDVQVFATSHSQECISAAIDSFKQDESKLSIHNILRRDNALHVATYHGEVIPHVLELNTKLR